MRSEPTPPRVADLRAGSEAAWREAVRLLGPSLRGYIALRGARDPDATLGEVFYELARRFDQLEGDWPSVRALAFVVARRRVVDDLRAAARRPVEIVDWQVAGDEIVGGDVEAEALGGLESAWLRSLLGRLTPLQRDIVTMRFVSELTVREIAEITGATESSVKANQRRAIASLRRHARAGGEEPGAVPSVSLERVLGALS